MVTYEEVLDRLKSRPRIWLVTGAAGFIGSHLVENLLKLDQRVVGLDNFSSGDRGNLAQVEDSVRQMQWRNFRFVEGDIRALSLCRQVCRSVEIVLHQAVPGSEPQSVADPLPANGTGVAEFLNMLTAAHGAGVSRFVYAGSGAVRGDGPGQPPDGPGIVRPLSPEELTRQTNELHAGIFARRHGLESIGLRYFNVFGPRQSSHGASPAVIPVWIAAMIRGDPVVIDGDGETVQDFCHVDNVVQANLLAATIDEPDAVDQVYNIGCGEGITLNELFGTLRSLLGQCLSGLRELLPVYLGPRDANARQSRADIGKASRLLGYLPVRPLSEGLAQAIDWYVATLAPRYSVSSKVPRPAAAASQSHQSIPTPRLSWRSRS